MFGLGPLFPQPELRPYEAMYRCYSIAMCPESASSEKSREMENGGKILLPHSALDWLTRLHIDYPMLFKLTNRDPERRRFTHSGVLEFHQEEGKCYIPYWMMRNLLLSEGELLKVEYVSLPVATYVKFKPQSMEFLDITNPRAVLELKLRSFACLTKGDIIAIEYNNKIYELLVQDLKPGDAASIIECDMNVEFDAPVGYKEPTAEKEDNQTAATSDIIKSANMGKFMPFSGKGTRLNGKSKSSNSELSPMPMESLPRGIPNYDYKPGRLNFVRTSRVQPIDKASPDAEKFCPFSGKGEKLRSGF